jgi:8-oxo-dGTP pyrophosphatase MutT (NUDIX family)
MSQDNPIRPAATVILLRDAADGFETLLLQRSREIAFGGAWAFPGGQVDEADRAGVDGDLAAARITAVRETSEETGLILSAEDLVPFAHWLTPPGFPRRFATWFFLARAVRGDVRVDGSETKAHRWMSPEAAVAARACGEIELPPPTFVTLEWIRASPDVRSALGRAQEAEIIRYAPRRLPIDGGTVSLYAGDVGYEDGDHERAGPRRRFYMLESGWRYEDDGPSVGS